MNVQTSSWSEYFKKEAGILRHLNSGRLKVSIFKRWLQEITDHHNKPIENISGYRMIGIDEKNLNIKCHIIKLLSEYMVQNHNNLSLIREALDFAAINTKTPLELLILPYEKTDLNSFEAYFNLVVKERPSAYLYLTSMRQYIFQNLYSIDDLTKNITLKLLVKHMYSIDTLNYLNRSNTSIADILQYSVFFSSDAKSPLKMLLENESSILFNTSDDKIAHHIGLLELIESAVFKETKDLDVLKTPIHEKLTSEYHETILKTEYPLEWHTYNLLKSMNPEKSPKELIQSCVGLSQTYNIESVPLPELNI